MNGDKKQVNLAKRAIYALMAIMFFLLGIISLCQGQSTWGHFSDDGTSQMHRMVFVEVVDTQVCYEYLRLGHGYSLLNDIIQDTCYDVTIHRTYYLEGGYYEGRSVDTIPAIHSDSTQAGFMLLHHPSDVWIPYRKVYFDTFFNPIGYIITGDEEDERRFPPVINVPDSIPTLNFK